MKITEKKDEPLLSRTMVTADLEFEKATPNHAEVTSMLASQLMADEKLIVVRHVYTEFGNRKAQVTAYVYHDEAKKQFFEPKVKVKKGAKGKEEKK